MWRKWTVIAFLEGLMLAFISGFTLTGYMVQDSCQPPPPPSITVLVPNGGESWSIGAQVPMRWTSSNVSGNVIIDLSRDGGATWATIIASTANDGAEPWTVTAPASTQCQIRISSVDNSAIFDTSDGVFTISPIDLIAPNGGEVWNLGTVQQIRWTSLPATGSIKIELSRTGGQSFETITPSTANTGVYNWTVSGAVTDQAVMKISLVETPAFYDTSGPFHIVDPNQPPRITLVEPGVQPVEPGEPWLARVTEGATTVLLLRGTNLNGVTVTLPARVPTSCFPTASIIGGDAAGTWLEVQIQVPVDPCVPMLHPLVVLG